MKAVSQAQHLQQRRVAASVRLNTVAPAQFREGLRLPASLRLVDVRHVGRAGDAADILQVGGTELAFCLRDVGGGAAYSLPSRVVTIRYTAAEVAVLRTVGERVLLEWRLKVETLGMGRGRRQENC